MRAIRLTEPRHLEYVEIGEPDSPGPGQCLVRTCRVGICGTDYGGYLGKMPFFRYPRIPGHELGVEVLEIGEDAGRYNVPLIYEPLNRYETNLICTVADGVEFLHTLSTRNVKLLADLFHMNIEEVSLAQAIQIGGDAIGHVHFVDSNRRPAGNGHMNLAPIASALREIGYDRYVSAEALPYPDPDTAAKRTIAAYNEYF